MTETQPQETTTEADLLDIQRMLYRYQTEARRMRYIGLFIWLMNGVALSGMIWLKAVSAYR